MHLFSFKEHTHDYSSTPQSGNTMNCELRKTERLCSRKAQEELFSGRHSSVMAFPIRAIFMPTEQEGVRILVSVSKRFFKRAVHRNRVKRQIREAYRLNKSMLNIPSGGMNIAFLWRTNEIMSTETVFKKIQSLLARINDSVNVSAEETL